MIKGSVWLHNEYLFLKLRYFSQVVIPFLIVHVQNNAKSLFFDKTIFFLALEPVALRVSFDKIGNAASKSFVLQDFPVKNIHRSIVLIQSLTVLIVTFILEKQPSGESWLKVKPFYFF